MTYGRINDDVDHIAWKSYHKLKDLVDATHEIINVNPNCKIMKIEGTKINSGNKNKPSLKISIADIGNSFCNMSIVVSSNQGFEILKLMTREVDAANRFSLTDGVIQGEFEIWDDDYEKRLYFCVDFTLKEAIMFAKQKNPVIGFSLVELPNMLVGGQKIFNVDDLRKVIGLKQIGDAKIKKPSHRWKTG